MAPQSFPPQPVRLQLQTGMQGLQPTLHTEHSCYYSLLCISSTATAYIPPVQSTQHAFRGMFPAMQGTHNAKNSSNAMHAVIIDETTRQDQQHDDGSIQFNSLILKRT